VTLSRFIPRHAAWLAVLTAGCSTDPTVEVFGTVTLDGKPLDKGEILFVAADGATRPVSGSVESGRYKVRVEPGRKKVMVNASKLSDTVDPNTRERQEYSIIPSAYNFESKLAVDVEPGSRQPKEANFDLKSKP
jgi:hypothetical protein